MSTQLQHDKVFIIVPVFNEAKVIADVLREVKSLGLQVVLVDDGSEEDVRAIIHDVRFLHFIRHPVNLGQGAAIQTGIDYALSAGADFLVTFDGDGQHDPGDLQAMLAPLQNGEVDITLGSRFLSDGGRGIPMMRKLVLKTGCFVNYLLTGIYLTDAHNGLRGMTRETAKKIRLVENRMAHATELLFTIRAQHLRYREVPVRVFYSHYSKMKGQSLFNSIRIAFDLVLHKLFE